MTNLYDHKLTPWTHDGNRCIVSPSLGGAEVKQIDFTVRTSSRSDDYMPYTVLIDADLFTRFEGPVETDTGRRITKNLGRDYYTLADLRAATFRVIDACPNVRFLAWTREPGEVAKAIPIKQNRPVCYSRASDPPAFQSQRTNIALAFRADSQATLDAGMPAFLRCEELCERLFLWLEVGDGFTLDVNGYVGSVDGVILSGHPTRPTPIAAVRSIISQCRAAGARVHVESLGTSLRLTYRDFCEIRPNAAAVDCKPDTLDVWPLRDGTNPNEWPADCRVREDVWG